METKTCSQCHKNKPITDFYQLSYGRGPESKCKICSKLRSKKYASKHRDKYNKYNRDYYVRNKEKISIQKQQYWNTKRRIVLEHLQSHPCTDCGNSDIRVLEFDHIRGQKRNGIAEMKGYSVKALIKEIAKCEVVCANCHRIRTETRNPTYKSKGLD